MKTKIEVSEDNVNIYCPNCDNWESLGIDDPRKRLGSFPIIKWEEGTKDENEKSINKCSECQIEFELEWDYTNIYIEKL